MQSAVFQNMAGEMCSYLNTQILWVSVRWFHFFKKKKNSHFQSVIVFLFVSDRCVYTAFFWDRQFSLSLNEHLCVNIHVLFVL